MVYDLQVLLQSRMVILVFFTYLQDLCIPCTGPDVQASHIVCIRFIPTALTPERFIIPVTGLYFWMIVENIVALYGKAEINNGRII